MSWDIHLYDFNAQMPPQLCGAVVYTFQENFKAENPEDYRSAKQLLL